MPATLDVLGRLASTPSAGRGSEAGWTVCPLCEAQAEQEEQRHGNGHLNSDKNEDKSHHNPATASNKRKRKRSTKLLAAGRGLAAHLHAVHAPWKQPSHHHQPPTEADRQAWDEKVLTILQQAPIVVDRGTTRTGEQAKSYRKSLPPICQYAADGNLTALRQLLDMVDDNDYDDADDDNGGGVTPRLNNKHINNNQRLNLLLSRDRHGSTAEHWAAGGGHLECLKFLTQLRTQLQEQCQTPEKSTSAQGVSDDTALERPKKMRRRDGKTPLHYACRNNRRACVEYLLQQSSTTDAVNTPSGDGTTPLHLACYGGNLDLVQYLVQEAGADLHQANAWGCTVAHWTAMSCRGVTNTNIEDSNLHETKVCALATWLAEQGVDFTLVQGQGHSPLHKAAQHQNRDFIQWWADRCQNQTQRCDVTTTCLYKVQPDQGGHYPWDIWIQAGGDASFAQWMRKAFGKPTDDVNVDPEIQDDSGSPARNGAPTISENR